MNDEPRVEALPEGVGPPLGAFARDLRTGSGPGTAFLPPMPKDAEGWKEAVAAAHARVRPLSASLAATLGRRQEALGAGPRAQAGIRALADPASPALAIVTGQQPGLLGGPLLTLHKAAGAIALARHVAAQTQTPVVPVFWLASEDHDFEEANRAGVIDRAGQPRVLRLATRGDGRSIVDLPVPDEDRETLRTTLAEALPDTERGREALALARTHPGENVARWCARTLVRLFGDSGLVVVEPEILWPESGETLAWLLDQAEPLREAVAATGERLRAAGLPAPLDPAPHATALFLRDRPRGVRQRVGLAADGRITLRDAPSDLRRDDLRALLEAAPERATGNVMGRVFVQNRHLPVLAYIAGPSEIAYQAQLRAAAEAMGEPFPLALPRPEATWVDARARRSAEAFGLTVAEVLAGREPSFAEGLPPDVADALESHLGTWPPAVQAALEEGGEGPQALKRALAELEARWQKSRSRVEAAWQRDAGVGRGRWERLHALLRPGGGPQERWLSALSLVARHGVAPVRAGLLDLDPLVPAHQLLHL